MSATADKRYWLEAEAASSNLEAALIYAQWGQPVIPCCPYPGKSSKAPWMPQPHRGHLDATTDPDQIKQWWGKHPDALIGAPIPDDMIVVDIDPRNGVTLEQFQARVGELTRTYTVHSGRMDGGVHLFYWRNTSALRVPFGTNDPDLDQKVHDWANPTFHMGRHNKTFPSGADIKPNGYTIVPPSLHPDTKAPYTYNDEYVRALPHNLWLWLQPPDKPPRPTVGAGGPSPAALEGLVRKLATSRNGNRNKILYWATKRLVENDYPEEAYDRLAVIAGQVGLPGSEINKTMNSAIRGAA